MTRKLLLVAAVLSIASLSGQSAFAQSQTNGADTPLTQTFRINVPKNITITCPDLLVEHVHDGNDTDQVFPVTQSWEVKGNAQAGVTVTFDLDGPFIKGAGNLDHLRRDASLQITPAGTLGPATWTSPTSTLTTDIATAKMSDSYTASSNGVGRAVFDLDMTFVNDLSGGGFGTYEDGVYNTTVTGEVTEN